MQSRWHFWASAILLVATFVYLGFLAERETIPLRKGLSSIPLHVGTWQGTDEGLDQHVIDILGVEDSLLRVYVRDDGPPISVYVGYYESQRKGDTIHSPKHCLPGSGWQPLSDQLQTVDLGSGERINVNRYLLEKGLDKQLVLYWYQERGRIVTSEYMAKVYLVLDAIVLNRTDGALVRISSPVISSVEETLSHQQEFIREIFPSLREALPE